jgi:hypothetical protein
VLSSAAYRHTLPIRMLYTGGDAQATGRRANRLPCRSLDQRVKQEVEQLIVRMAGENRDWGYDRIVGALANRDVTATRQSP